MEYDVYHIPANFTDAGRLFGLFETRNAIEAVVLCIPTLFCCIRFLPFSITVNIIITLSLLVPIGGFALIGIQDDSLTRFVALWWRWRKRRMCRTYRGEVLPHGIKRTNIRR